MEKIECEWYSTKEKPHPDKIEGDRSDHTVCLVVRKRYGMQVLAWNHVDCVWDDDQMDDYECGADEIDSFMALPKRFPPL